MVVADTVDDAYHVLRTMLTGKNGGFFSSIDDAMNAIKGQNKEIVYDTDNGIDC